MTSFTVPRTLAASAIAVIALLGLTGCGNAPGELGQNQQLLASCPSGKKLNTLVEYDGTGTSQSKAITSERLRIIADVARKTAVCGGHLTVSIFAAGSASTVTVYDGDLDLSGATDNARLRRVPDAVDKVVAEVKAAYPKALSSLPPGGTDVIGLYRLAEEQQAQFGKGYQLNFIVLTDGLNNLAGVDLDTRPLSPAEATALADSTPVPKLPGASVTVAGLGRVAEGAVPSGLAEGLVAYYDRLCHNTGASSCLSITDWR